MAVMAREAWTDERLDDLKGSVDTGFAEVRAEFRAVRGEIAALNRTIHQFMFAMVGTVLLSSVATIGAILTLA
jgi:hypothetical protein